jgi:long-chain acyl-CoA synthetase
MECLNDMLARNVRAIGDKTYLITDKETLTFKQFDDRTTRMANVLAARGVTRGERVGLFLPSTALMAIGFWACQKIGAIPVPMSAMYRETEVRNVLKVTGMVAIITNAETVTFVTPLRAEFPGLKTVLTEGKELNDLVAAASPVFAHVQLLPTDICCLFFTSGTTGVPKGTVQTHFAQCSSFRDMMAFHRSRFATEVYYCAAPLFSNLGMTVTINFAIYTGGSVVLHDRWQTARVLDAIGKHKVTFMAGTPTMYVYLLNEYDAKKHDLSSLRLVTNGGSPVSEVIAKKFEEISGAPVLQVYGATETLGQNVMEPYIGIRKAGSAGVAVGSAHIEILDDDGNPLPAGKIGEVRISGDTVASGYWNDPVASAKTFTPKGWISGDLGYLDDDGYLFIVDRKKDVIISGGHNIYPLEVENILYKHAAVGMCAVIGVPDEAKGEIPAAIIVVKDGQKAAGKDIIEFCRANLSAYKSPRAVYFIETMPEGAGKIRKNELLAMIKSGKLTAAP